jgi:hypothetical protein
MIMKGGAPTGIISAAGFTLVEVMIFLAISGVMFVSALNLFNGKQNETEFTTGLNTFVSQLQSTINNVSTGYYNVADNVICTPSGSGSSAVPVPSLAAAGSPSKIGQNYGCTYIGEVLSFESTNATGNQVYKAYPIVGLQYAQNTPPAESTSLADARPQTLASLASTTTMPYGLTIHSIKYLSTSTTAIGFFTSFNSYASESGLSQLSSGSQNIQLVPIPGATTTSTVADINSLTSSNSSSVSDPEPCGIGVTNSVCYTPNNGIVAPINPTTGITMCVDSGSTDQSAILTFGSISSASEISQQIQTGHCT